MKTLMILTMVYQGWFSETMTINTEVITADVCSSIKKAYELSFPKEDAASAYVMCLPLE